MALDPITVRTADPLAQDQDMAADDIAALQGKAQIVKPAFGAEGAGTMVSADNPLPVTVLSESYVTGGRAPARVDVDSASATLVSAADPTLRGRTITNPGPVDVWIGHTNAVTASGATTGQKLLANFGNGSYVMDERYRGNIYARAAEAGAYVTVQEV